MGLPLTYSVCFFPPQQDPCSPGWHFCPSIEKVKETSAVLVWALYKQRVSKFNKCLLELVKEVINTGAHRAPSASHVWLQESRLFIISIWLSSSSWEGCACGVNTLIYLYLFESWFCLFFFLTRPGEAGSGAVPKGRHGREVSGLRGAWWGSQRDEKDGISYGERWHREAVSSSFLSRWEVKIRNMKWFA